jgi:hypothetical protein
LALKPAEFVAMRRMGAKAPVGDMTTMPLNFYGGQERKI